MVRSSQKSHANKLTLFLWHMPDGATESVAEHSSRLQPSINLHASVTALCSAALVPNVLPRRDEDSGKPCAVIKALQYIGPQSGFEPGWPDSKS